MRKIKILNQFNKSIKWNEKWWKMPTAFNKDELIDFYFNKFHNWISSVYWFELFHEKFPSDEFLSEVYLYISLYRSIFHCWWAVPFCHGEYTINMNVWTRFISRTISTHLIDRMKINIVLLAYLLLLLSNSIIIIIPFHRTYSYAWNALASAIMSFFIENQLNRINEKIINFLFLFNIDDIALARQVNM